MKPIQTAALAALALATLAGAAAPEPESEPEPELPHYDANGHMLPPADYRDWVFLSSGVDMSYTDTPTPAGQHVFDNVFVPRAAYEGFRKTGMWPEKTILMLENRAGASKGSINRSGAFQAGEVIGREAHVKDARFKGGWAFFGFGGDKPAAEIPHAAACYSCHEQHAAADTTFVQFYPTLLPVATKLGTLSKSYLAEAAAPPAAPPAK